MGDALEPTRHEHTIRSALTDKHREMGWSPAVPAHRPLSARIRPREECRSSLSSLNDKVQMRRLERTFAGLGLAAAGLLLLVVLPLLGYVVTVAGLAVMWSGVSPKTAPRTPWTRGPDRHGAEEPLGTRRQWLVWAVVAGALGAAGM